MISFSDNSFKKSRRIQYSAFLGAGELQGGASAVGRALKADPARSLAPGPPFGEQSREKKKW